MFLFDDLKESHENQIKDPKVMLEEVTHRVHYCIEDLLKQDCWDSQEVSGTVNTRSATCVG